MTIAIVQQIQQPLSFEEFLTRYGGDNRYELIDGEVFDLEPTYFRRYVSTIQFSKMAINIQLRYPL